MDEREESAARAAMDRLAAEAFGNADAHGFYDDLFRMTRDAASGRDVRAVERAFMLTQLAEVTGEVGEAVSALQLGDRAGFEEELADVLIRVFSMCGLWNIDIGYAVVRKMRINRARPFRHGKVCGP